MASTIQRDKAIELSGVCKVRECGSGGFKALKSASLRIEQEEYVVLLGKSGSGKTTPPSMVSGIDRPSAVK